MTTFVLKKYETTDPEQTSQQAPAMNEDTQKEELTVSVVGSISEIVANALYKALAHKVHIHETPDTNLGETNDTKAISTEDINSAPLDTFNSIKKDDVVFIHNKGFKTAQEEWFLTNIPNKTANVFYTVESFINHIKLKLNLV